MPKVSAARLSAYLKDIANQDDVTKFSVDEAGLESMRANVESIGGGTEALRPRIDAASVNAGLEAIESGRDLSYDQLLGIEAIIIPDKRPSMSVANGTYRVVHPLWLHLEEAETKARLTKAARSVGRIEVPGSPYPYGGTGFVVGTNLVMTNRHVAEIFASGLGDRRLAFLPGIAPGFSRSFAPDNAEQAPLAVRRVVMIHPYWDMALLEVEGLPAEAEALILEPRNIAGFEKEEIAVIGYPAYDPRNDRGAQKTVFDNRFGIKQLQPGLLKERGRTESFRKVVNAATHDCSTLGGNSGSAVIHIKSGRVLALHFGGEYLARNYAVPASELAADRRVTDTQVRFDPKANPDTPPSWSGYWAEADASEAVAGASALSSGPATAQADVAPRSPASTAATATGAVDLVIPLHITIRLGPAGLGEAAAVAAGAVTAAGTAGVERLAETAHDTDYRGRKGFDPNFLGLRTPMPLAADPAAVARTRAGGERLDYQNFSIMMHAKRRLALVAASNVYAADAVKTPERGRIYTRKALGELGPNDQEKWFLDPRLDAAFQLPDVFYTRDDGAFDKGHIVRRDDAAWGLSFDDLKRANGDTYHVTNCSPQVSAFNRSAGGKENWGDLENVVLRQAASEKLCLFAGPFLAADDPRFLGAFGDGRREMVQIPTRFWKVIVARTAQGLAAFGFVLEQDLSDVDTREFAVPEAFRRFMMPLAEIAEAASLVFPVEILDAEQFDERGLDVAAQAAIGRRRRS